MSVYVYIALLTRCQLLHVLVLEPPLRINLQSLLEISVYVSRHGVIVRPSPCTHCFCLSLTGSIARSAKCQLFNLLRGRFWGFLPHRCNVSPRHVAPMGVKFGTEEGTFGPLLRAKFHPHLCNDKGIGPLKLKFLLIFGQNVEYKRPAGAYPLCDFHKICRICTSFQDALAVKVSLNFLKGLWSYGRFNLTGSDYP